MYINKAEMSIMDISKFNREMKDKREYLNYRIETENYVLMKKKYYEELVNRNLDAYTHGTVGRIDGAR